MNGATAGRTPTALTIAGSDSGGGAGIQADLKTFAALGVYGTSAITAVTAQNTCGVWAVTDLDAAIVAAQIDAVVTDIGADAVKTGMLANEQLIAIVADRVRQHGVTKLVVDPVMVATSGDVLLPAGAVVLLSMLLLPLALVVTPNRPEAEMLSGHPISDRPSLEDAARRIADRGARYVLIKGGHAEGPATDVLFDGQTFREFSVPRIATTSTHGTGCTLSAAITAYLARGRTVEAAVAAAKVYLTAALQAAVPIGHGHGPVHHLFGLAGSPAEDETPQANTSSQNTRSCTVP